MDALDIDTTATSVILALTDIAGHVELHYLAGPSTGQQLFPDHGTLHGRFLSPPSTLRVATQGCPVTATAG